ncbi:MAG: hypothetical protein H8E38_09695 [SAR324 cluster bacterium]|nr:hypothetical protein [SAR324 cluster bacterium]MBL7034823.1 hypothetical protein [SAR324 cluster bacterium]
MRTIILLLCFFKLSFSLAAETEQKLENHCLRAVNQESEYIVSGIYGSPLESEWHPAAAYVLLREMARFEILQREFQQKTATWRFDFAEMLGGKTIVFVYHLQNMEAYCRGPNAFFVVKK